MDEPILTPELVSEWMDAKRLTELRELVGETQSADLALIFEEIPEEYRLRFFRLLPKERAAETFTEMSPDVQERLIAAFSDAELRRVLVEMFYDDTVDLIEEMPSNVVKRILANTHPDDRRVINELLKYPPESAGGIMNVEYVSLRPTNTVEDAIRIIRRVGTNKETIYTCYVTDANRHLLGIVEAKDLLLADGETLISEIMEENIVMAHTLDDQEEAAQLLQKYDLLALPVVDTEGRLVGIVTVDDAMEVISDETEEDFSVMAAMQPTETPYIRSSAFSIWKSRFPWLAILMISATFTGIIISGFEAALAQVVILTSFIPMLMGTGGNSGAQASVTVIRGLSMGELTPADWFRVLWKELRVSILCGISLGILTFGKVLLIDRLLLANPEVTVSVALVVAISLCLVVIAAKLIGCLLPLLAEKIGLDPAVMASPFITTLVDAIALLLYFGIAYALIPGLA